MEDLFRQFWWLMFPVAGLVYGLVGMMQQNSVQNRAIDVLKTYADQGKEPPPEILKALSQQADTDFTGMSSGRSNSGGPVSSAWWTFFIFLALTAGFGVGMGGFSSDAKSAFLTVTVIMGILAAGAFIMAIYATLRGRK